MACAIGRSVYLGLAKCSHRGGVRALWDEPVGLGVHGLVRAVFAGRGVQLLEVAMKSRRASFLSGASSNCLMNNCSIERRT
jgi:hypothetical protein